MTERTRASAPGLPVWALTLVVALTIGAALALLATLGGAALPERTGPPVEELTVERVLLEPGTIELVVRNSGPDPVAIGQVFVNDSYVDFAGSPAPIGRLGSDTLRLAHPWISGQPYVVSLLTSTGLVIEHEIPAAVATPAPDAGFFGLMVLLGTYVGIVPVLLGMLLLPVLRRVGRGVVRVLLAVTVGLLAFLAVDAALDGTEIAAVGGAAFGGALIVFLGAGLAFLALTAVDGVLRRRAAGTPRTGVPLATMVATGIGLHNLGEGLAIGSAYAVGELALGAALVVGFALHNTTEGLAVVAPLTAQRPRPILLAGLGLLAGAPAVLGALIGATVHNATLTAFLLGIGVGAIVQVIVQIVATMRQESSDRGFDPQVIGGVAAGVIVMYLTGLAVAV